MPPGRRRYGRGRLARAARGNIDCGRVATKSLPAWPEAPTFAWACWHGRVHSIQGPNMVGVFIRSVVGAASDRGAALWTMWRRNAAPAGGSEWQLHWKTGAMKQRSWRSRTAWWIAADPKRRTSG